MASSKRDPYRNGVAAFYLQIANYVFYAKKHNKHLKRALDFIIVRLPIFNVHSTLTRSEPN